MIPVPYYTYSTLTKSWPAADLMPSWFAPFFFKFVDSFQGWLGTALVPVAILGSACTIIFTFASVPLHRIPPLWGPWIELAAASFRRITCSQGPLREQPLGSLTPSAPRVWWRRAFILLLPLLPLPIALGVMHRVGGMRLSCELRAIAKCVAAVDRRGVNAAIDGACEDLRNLVPIEAWDPYTGCKPTYSWLAHRQCNALRMLMLKPTETDTQCVVALFNEANDSQNKATCGARAKWVVSNTPLDWSQALDKVATEFPKECGELANGDHPPDGAGRCVWDLIRFATDALSKPSAAL